MIIALYNLGVLGWVILALILEYERTEWAAWHDPGFLEGVHTCWAKGITKYEKMLPHEWEALL